MSKESWRQFPKFVPPIILCLLSCRSIISLFPKYFLPLPVQAAEILNMFALAPCRALLSLIFLQLLHAIPSPGNFFEVLLGALRQSLNFQTSSPNLQLSPVLDHPVSAEVLIIWEIPIKNYFEPNRLWRIFRCHSFAGGRETEKDGDGGQGGLIENKLKRNWKEIEKKTITEIYKESNKED